MNLNYRKLKKALEESDDLLSVDENSLTGVDPFQNADNPSNADKPSTVAQLDPIVVDTTLDEQVVHDNSRVQVQHFALGSIL